MIFYGFSNRTLFTNTTALWVKQYFFLIMSQKCNSSDVIWHTRTNQPIKPRGQKLKSKLKKCWKFWISKHDTIFRGKFSVINIGFNICYITAIIDTFRRVFTNKSPLYFNYKLLLRIQKYYYYINRISYWLMHTDLIQTHFIQTEFEILTYH